MNSFKEAKEKVLGFCNGVGLDKPEVKYVLRENNGVKVVCSVVNTRQKRKNTVIFHVSSNLSIDKVKIIDAFGAVFTVGYSEFDVDAKALAS